MEAGFWGAVWEKKRLLRIDVRDTRVLVSEPALRAGKLAATPGVDPHLPGVRSLRSGTAVPVFLFIMFTTSSNSYRAIRM